MRDDRERLAHMLEAIAQIERYAKRGKAAFESDELIQNWIVRHLQVFGEAARATSEDFRKRHAEVPWKKIIGMRHILVHDYFKIDSDVVWSVVEKDLPAIKNALAALVPAPKK